MRPLALLALLAACPAAGQAITTDPGEVSLVLDDVRRLALLLDSGEVERDTLGALEHRYLAAATPGLRAYAERYHVTPASMASALARYPEAYADLGALADSVLAQRPAMESGFHALRDLLPRAAYPPVWFVVGHHGAGGMAHQEGAIVALERYAARPEDVVPLVLHEVAHFQQAMIQGVERYRRIYGPDQTLLALALREGVAELVAELTTGRHTNPQAEAYGLAHERALWQEFEEAMHERDLGTWMFVRPPDPNRPPDLGYWMGYRIARRYYDRAEDKRQALHALLNAQDYTALLAESGYAEQFAEE